MTRNRRLGYTLLAVLFSAGLSAETMTAQTYDVLEFFNSAGLSPQTRLIQATDGNLYGTTPYSRANGYGTIFKIDTNGTTLTTLHSFTYNDGAYPYGGLIQGSDGNLYGTTLQGGTSGKGTIFKIDTNGTTLTTLHSFTNIDGATPFAPLIQGSDGNLYGTAGYGGSSNCNGGCGTIFKIDTGGTAFTTLHSFVNTDGAFPYAGLIQGADGNLYGTAAVGSAGAVVGTIFKIDTNGSSFTTLHEFVSTDGATPYGGVIQGADGYLYGTTNVGGASDNGTIFKIHTNGTAFTTLHNFAYTDGAHPWVGLIQGTDGNLYGTGNVGGASGYGTLFKINTSGTAFMILHSFNLGDGAYLYAGLTQAADGKLYGTTNRGGAGGWGTIFKIDINGTTLTTLHSFVGSDGVYPYGGLIQGSDGNFYGTTRVGGTGGYGTIFKLDTSGTTLTTLHDFAASDGAFPFAGLIQRSDGNLYGTTYGGGASGYGTIFKIDTGGTTLTTLHNFAHSDGAFPYAGLIQGTDGNLYGTTYQGGPGGCTSGCGTIFRINITGSTFTVLHSFSGGDGANPWANLVQAADGNLYGTTYGGGPSGVGTVFRINTAGTNFTTLHNLHPSGDGAYPYGGLMQAADGNLYGTASQGGNGCVPNGCGTVFRIDTNGTTFTTLHSFANGEDGGNPQAGLIQGSDGSLYGTAVNGGTRGQGTIFRIGTGGALTTLHSFTMTDGASPSTALIQAADGNLYGTGSGGGPAFGGVTFRLILTGAAFQVTGVTPASGPSSGGTAVSITGSGFSSTDTVSLAGFAATGVTPVGPTQIDATTPALSPGTVNDLVVTKLNLSSAQLSGGFFADFLDVPQSDSFHDFVVKIFRHGITAGCGGGNYCPDSPVTRAQMAVFLLKGKHGSAYAPPLCTGKFQDVECTPTPAFAVNWIEELYSEGITGGCSSNPLLYCPDQPVTRAQMAVFLLTAKHGSGYTPPSCRGIFGDVPCPSGFAVNWIEELDHEGIAAGCQASPPLYCPNNPNTRDQMAVFLVTTFGL